jgi:hypothetical protein
MICKRWKYRLSIKELHAFKMKLKTDVVHLEFHTYTSRYGIYESYVLN